MAPKSSKQKKKYKCCPCLLSSSLQEDVPGEQLTRFEAKEEETNLMCLFENYLEYMETPAQNQEKVKLKAKKHRKKWKTWNVEKKPPSLTMGKENVALATNNLVPKTDKCLVKSKNDAEELSGLESDKRGFCKKVDSTFLKFLPEKKGKKLKKLEDCDFMDGNEEAKHKQCREIFKAIPKSHSMEKQLCLPWSSEPYVNRKGKQKGLSQRAASGLQVPRKSEALDPTVRYFRGSVIKGFKQNRKQPKEAQYGVSTSELNSCASIAEPLLSSSPMTVEIKTCDSEEELNVGSLKNNRPTFHPGSGIEVISSSFDSQELFITQKSFLQQQIPSSYHLPFNPVAGIEETLLEISCDDSNSSDTRKPLSAGKETFQVAPSSLISRKKGEQFLATRECAVQTDDFFGSLAVASSLIIKKDFPECRDQPMDLSLPYRIRSCATNAERVSYFLGAAGNDIHVCPRSKLEHAKTVLDGEPRNARCSPSRKSDDVKYIQTQLNSSYFFKPKGDLDATLSGSPLVKPALGNKEKNN